MSACGAVVAALAAARSARLTKKATEAQLFSSIYSKYGLPEMRLSLRRLRKWEFEKGDEFAAKWKIAFDAGDKDAHNVELASKHVRAYFLLPLRLYEASYVSKKFVKEVCLVAGRNILYDIVEALENAFNPAYDRSKIEKIRKICGRAKTKRLFPPVVESQEGEI